MNESTALPFAPDKPWLAPLAGYSDLPFRLLCRGYGAACACTEMVSAKGLVYSSPGTETLLATKPEDDPLVVQLFGADPEIMTRAMAMCLEMGFTSFDLNAGCPVKKVLKSDSGAGMLKNADNLVAVAREMVRLAGPGRVGVKLRLGFFAGENVFLDVCPRLEDAGVAWVTLHPRHARQMFTGRADWSRLPELRQRVSIPVLASGDLFTAEDGVDCLERTGVDAVMYARGAMYDPAVFARHLSLLGGEAPAPAHGHGRGGNGPGTRPPGPRVRRLPQGRAQDALRHPPLPQGDGRHPGHAGASVQALLLGGASDAASEVEGMKSADRSGSIPG